MNSAFPEYTRNELLDLMNEYNNYIMQANDDNDYKDGWRPVSLYEFESNEYQDILDERIDLFDEEDNDIGILFELGNGVTIFGDHFEDEIVHWTKQEWEEDPDVVYAIINAVILRLQEGSDQLKHRINKPKE